MRFSTLTVIAWLGIGCASNPWRQAGFGPTDQANWNRMGVQSVDDVVKWYPLKASQAEPWIQSGTTSSEFQKWAAQGIVDFTQAKQWMDLGIDGFKIADIREAFHTPEKLQAFKNNHPDWATFDKHQVPRIGRLEALGVTPARAGVLATEIDGAVIDWILDEKDFKLTEKNVLRALDDLTKLNRASEWAATSLGPLVAHFWDIYGFEPAEAAGYRGAISPSDEDSYLASLKAKPPKIKTLNEKRKFSMYVDKKLFAERFFAEYPVISWASEFKQRGLDPQYVRTWTVEAAEPTHNVAGCIAAGLNYEWFKAAKQQITARHGFTSLACNDLYEAVAPLKGGWAGSDDFLKTNRFARVGKAFFLEAKSHSIVGRHRGTYWLNSEPGVEWLDLDFGKADAPLGDIAVIAKCVGYDRKTETNSFKVLVQVY